ncbi:MAG TPA: hypothetical protein VMY35_15975 [Phycisphaerae bacterium]|nr:hypothetical protein [Phycisphaerae bacterium]
MRVGDTDFDPSDKDPAYPWLVWMLGDDEVYRTHGHGFETKAAARAFIRSEVCAAWRLEHAPTADIVDEG